VTSQDDDVHLGLLFADPTQHGSAIDTWHPEIGNDAIESSGGQTIDAFLSAAGRLDMAALITECLLYREAYEFLIVDDQYAHKQVCAPQRSPQ
jgi:hypothetical protein